MFWNQVEAETTNAKRINSLINHMATMVSVIGKMQERISVLEATKKSKPTLKTGLKTNSKKATHSDN